MKSKIKPLFRVRPPSECDTTHDARQFLESNLHILEYLAEEGGIRDIGSIREACGMNFIPIPAELQRPETLIGCLDNYFCEWRNEPNMNLDIFLRLVDYASELEIPLTNERIAWLPFTSDFAYLMVGPMHQLAKSTLNLARLNNVTQLGNVWYYASSTSKAFNRLSPKHRVGHTRLTHSLTASALMEKTLCRLTDDEYEIAHGTFAGLLHDLATPGLGDTAKTLDREGLDEEKNLGRMVSPQSRYRIYRRLGLDFSKIERIVQGTDDSLSSRLLHSKGLDLDKLAYIAMDALQYLSFSEVEGINDELSLRLVSTLKGDPHLFDLHKSIHLRDGDIVFGERDRVLNALIIRALLHESLYLTPDKNAKEAYFQFLFSPFYGRGNLDADAMRQMNDSDVAFTFMSSIMGLRGARLVYDRFGSLLEPKVKRDIDLPHEIFCGEYLRLDFYEPFYVGQCPYDVLKFDTLEQARSHSIDDPAAERFVRYSHYAKFQFGEKTLVIEDGHAVPLESTFLKRERDEAEALRRSITSVYKCVPKKEYLPLFLEAERMHKKIEEDGYLPPVRRRGSSRK